MNETFKKHITQTIKSIALRDLEEHGMINPFAIFGKQTDGVISEFGMMALDLSSEAAEDFSIEILKHQLKERNANFVLKVTEAWSMADTPANIKDIYERYGSITDCPYRKEVLSIKVELDGKYWLVLGDLIRKGKTKTIGELKFITGIGLARTNNLLPMAA